MKRVISLLMCVVLLCSMLAVSVTAAENHFDTFHSAVQKLWFAVVFGGGEDNIYEFTPYQIKWVTNYKLDMYQYDSYDKLIECGSNLATAKGDTTYSYTLRYYAIPADVYEAQALKLFNISDINILRNDVDNNPVYNEATHTYDMPVAGGMGDSITYAQKGYKDLGNGKYEVYGYTVEQAYEKPDGAILGVDYIIMPDYGNAAEILKCLRITVEYNGADVKFLSWETIALEDVPADEELVVACAHPSTKWKTVKKATVNSKGKKEKVCTECGEVLETKTIAQLKCSKPTLKSIENTEYGVKIKWGSVSGADKYYVYRKTSSGSYDRIASTTNTYYTDKSAKSGKKYYYIVKAINEAGSSDSSSSKSIYHLADTTLSTPKSTKSGVKLSWKKVTGAEGYVVYRKTGSGSYSKLATVKGNSKVTYTDASAKKGKKYTYKIKAYKSKTYSAYSNAKAVTDKY